MLHLPLVHRASTIWQSSFLASSTAISFARSTHDSPDVCVMMYVCISASFWYVSTSVCLSDVCLHHCVYLTNVCIAVCHDSPDVCLHQCVCLMYVCITVCFWCMSASLHVCDDVCLHQSVYLVYVCITVCHDSPDVCVHQCVCLMYVCITVCMWWVSASVWCMSVSLCRSYGCLNHCVSW